jgi:hypothetical protein
MDIQIHGHFDVASSITVSIVKQHKVETEEQ